MTSFKQIAANRLNASKSTGPRTTLGKERSRYNALRHGLTAETVISALECAADYQGLEASILTEYNPRTATERELVIRLASVLWRLRRSTSIETGLLQTEAELMQEDDVTASRGRITRPPPQWSDELDGVTSVPSIPLASDDCDDSANAMGPATVEAQKLAACFVRVGHLGHGTFDLLRRYEAALWRQAAQILVMLRAFNQRQ